MLPFYRLIAGTKDVIFWRDVFPYVCVMSPHPFTPKIVSILIKLPPLKVVRFRQLYFLLKGCEIQVSNVLQHGSLPLVQIVVI